jgi:hypothetical protein
MVLIYFEAQKEKHNRLGLAISKAYFTPTNLDIGQEKRNTLSDPN